MARPRPSGTQPQPSRPLTGLVIRAPGRRPVVAPGLRQRDVLARRGDPRGTHHREFVAIAPGIAAASLPAAGQFDGRARWPAPRCRRCRQSHAALSVPPGHGRDNALRTSACDRASTGHVWITIWRRYGREPFRIFSQPSQPTASVLVTGGGAARVSRARPLAPHRHPAYLHSSSTSVVHSPYTRDFAGAGVIGACSHADPGYRKITRARLPSVIAAVIILGTAASLNWEDPKN